MKRARTLVLALSVAMLGASGAHAQSGRPESGLRGGLEALRVTDYAKAERELSAFFAAVKTSFGPEQAKLSAEDWLDAIEQVLGPNQPTSRDWRAVTIVASSRLAHRLAAARGNADFLKSPMPALSLGCSRTGGSC